MNNSAAVVRQPYSPGGMLQGCHKVAEPVEASWQPIINRGAFYRLLLQQLFDLEIICIFAPKTAMEKNVEFIIN